MKIRNITIALPIILLTACSNTNPEGGKGVEIKGKLTNPHNEILFLEQMTPQGNTKVDSAVVSESGEFKMNPAINEIGFYRLRITERNFATLILNTNEKVMILGDAADLGNTYTIEGSTDSKLFWEVNKASSANYRLRDSIQQLFQAFVNTAKNDTIRTDSMSKVMEKPYTELINKHNKYLQNFVEKNTTSFASLAAIQQLQGDEYFQTYVKLDDGLYKKYPTSVFIKSFHENVMSQKKLGIGTLAPEIIMNNTLGKPTSLSSLKGKIVLIDFWASWCGPCRAENPNVVKAYDKYKSKGFDIFSVSLDKDADKWKQAISKDGLIWMNHVSDLQMWQSPIVQLYNFSSIPTNVLIDKEGKIIAKNLRGEALENKLNELFK